MTRFGTDAVFDKVAREVDSLGLRPFARKAGLPVGVIRSAKDRRDISHENMSALCDALGLELYIGPPRTTPDDEVTDSEFAKIRRYDVEAAAGAGAANGDHPASSDLAFRRDWLSRLGLNPNSACAITIKGDSMDPTISGGDLALIDTRVDFPIPGEIYAVCLANGDLVVKRMGDAKEAVLLTSDNRDHGVIMIDKGDLPATRFVGRVVWTGRAVGGKGISTADQAALKKRWKELTGGE